MLVILNKFDNITMSEWKNYVKELKKVGGGENGILTMVFNDISDIAANIRLDIINASPTYGVFSENWKCSLVVPVQKGSKTDFCSEFRSVNNVPVYVKVLEMVVKAQIEKNCNTNRIIVGNQCLWGCYVLVVLFDFRKAFETVNKDILIKKLLDLGFVGIILKYLSNCTQVVIFKNCMSDALKVENVAKKSHTKSKVYTFNSFWTCPYSTSPENLQRK